jgi:secretion/DNA translocation related CpaE-like protein
VTPPSPVPRPLLVSSDDDLVDDVLRVLAAAGTPPERAAGGPALRRAHRTAPLVLLGADVLDADRVRALPRRAALLVVARGELAPEGWAAAVELGAERVVRLPEDEGWLLSRAVSAAAVPVPRGWLLAVGGSCGGAGASSVAAAVALSAAASGPLLVDADAWGGGLDLLLGAESVEGLRWPELTGLRGRVSGEALTAALPDVGGVALVSAARSGAGQLLPEAVAAVVDAARADGRPVVVDLPRTGPPDAAPAGAVLAEADLALLVVPTRLRSVCAAAALVQAPGSPWAAALLVLRAVPGGLSRAQTADVTGRPVLAELGHDRAAAARAERGEPPAVGPRTPLGVLARRVLAELPRPAREAA